jgi:hypothetical protein
LHFSELYAAEWTFVLVLNWYFRSCLVSVLSRRVLFRGISLVWSIPSICFFSVARWLLSEPFRRATFSEIFTCFLRPRFSVFSFAERPCFTPLLTATIETYTIRERSSQIPSWTVSDGQQAQIKPFS